MELTRMIRIGFQVSKQKRLTAWFVASAIGFHSHEDGVDLRQHLRIVEFQNPAFLGRIVLVENA